MSTTVSAKASVAHNGRRNCGQISGRITRPQACMRGMPSEAAARNFASASACASAASTLSSR